MANHRVLLRKHIISINSLSQPRLQHDSLLAHRYFYHALTVSNTSTVSQYTQNYYIDVAY